jgi:hypothetical protein
LNAGLGTATDSHAGAEYLLVHGDSGTVHGIYYWKDVDANEAINVGDEFAFIGIVMTNNAMLAADLTS